MGDLFFKFNKSIGVWIKALDNYTMEELLRKPSDDSWSLGQVYIHIAMANKTFLGKNAELCALGQDVLTDGKGKNKWGKLIFAFNMFPPLRVKMPKKATGGVEPNQPESKQEILLKLNENLAFFKSIEDTVIKAPKINRKKYPFLGYLNAREWYTIGTLHMKHHLRQKARLDKFLGK